MAAELTGCHHSPSPMARSKMRAAVTAMPIMLKARNMLRFTLLLVMSVVFIL